MALVETNPAPMGVQLVSSRMTNKMSSSGDLVELAQHVQKADEFIRANAGNRLRVIADQIKYLQEQARRALEEAKRDNELHHAACNIVKRPGTIYHLYRRESGQTYLSILSPQEWGGACPHEFLASYRLEYDQSWTPLEELDRRSQENAIVDKVLNSQLALTESPHFGLQGAFTKTEGATVQEVTSQESAAKS